MLRAALFAFHDVLVDDAPLHRECLQRALSEEGVSLAPSIYAELYPGGDPKTALASLLAAAGLPPSPLRQIRLETRESTYYQERVRAEGLPLGDGVRELVAALARAEWTLGVVSGASRQEIERALEAGGLREPFKVLITGEEVPAAKRDAEPYLLALTALNAQPPLPERLFHAHEILAVEAGPQGVAAARGCGCSTLGVGRGALAERLAADWVVASLAEVTPARLHQRFAEASRS